MGKGENFSFLMQGAAPLASPGELNPGGTGAGGRTTRPAGGLSPRFLARLALATPGGGRRFRSPADLAVPESAGAACLPCRRLVLSLALFLSPIPPTPFPTGWGWFFVYFAGGFAPGTPEAGACGSVQGGKESVVYRLARAVRVQPRGCKGRSPLHEITLVSPSPEGKGRGWGQNTLRFSPGAPPPAPRRREPTVRCKRGEIGCLQVSRCRTGSAPCMK